MGQSERPSYLTDMISTIPIWAFCFASACAIETQFGCPRFLQHSFRNAHARHSTRPEFRKHTESQGYSLAFVFVMWLGEIPHLRIFILRDALEGTDIKLFEICAKCASQMQCFSGNRERKVSPKFFCPKFFGGGHGRPRVRVMDVCAQMLVFPRCRGPARSF